MDFINMYRKADLIGFLGRDSYGMRKLDRSRLLSFWLGELRGWWCHALRSEHCEKSYGRFNGDHSAFRLQMSTAWGCSDAQGKTQGQEPRGH